MKFKKILTLVLSTVLMTTTLASCKKDNLNVPKFSDETINIGVSGPLSGGAAVYGQSVQNSAKLAIHEINEKGGLDGTLFAFNMYDDKHDPTLVSDGYASLLENGMQISLGTVTTGPALEFKELAKNDNLFVLTPSATGDAVPEYDNAFQMCFADSNQGTASAEYFNSNYQGKKVGVFYKSDEDYSTGILAKFEETLSESFGEVVKASFKGEESDFAAQVEILKDCEIIFMPIYYTPASQFMLAGKNKIKSNAIYYGCDGLDGVDAISGFDINTIPQEVSYLSHFNSSTTVGAAKDYIDAYKKTFGEDAPLSQFGAAAYDCVYAIYEALKVAKANGANVSAATTASDFCEILKTVFVSDSFVFHGITGAPEANGKSNISWSADGFVNKNAVKYIVKEASN
ncbi:MAG: ABC transporter substrate-binding protein [Clostridia bacterium]|nr:ABC transporter substrate-binding protein [Clostridia bacterium]